MTYPVGDATTLKALERTELDAGELVAARGLARTMDYAETGQVQKPNRTFALGTFAYKPGVPKVFAPDLIGD